MTPAAAVLRGMAAGAVGLLAMDLVWYERYRREGGENHFLEWEFGGESSWDKVSAPGQVGRRLYEGFTHRELPGRWARLTDNIVHWGYGITWGALFGIAAGSASRPRLVFGPPFGTVVFLTSYLVMPLSGLYKSIWEYDERTLLRDLTAHFTYGTGVAAAFRLLAPGNRDARGDAC